MAGLGWLFGWAKSEGIDIPISGDGTADIPKLLKLYDEWQKKNASTKHNNGYRQNTPHNEIVDLEALKLPDEQLPFSLSAKWKNHDIAMPDGSTARFMEGTKLHHIEVFAGKGTKTQIRDIDRLVTIYGGKPEEWQKVKGFGTLEIEGKSEEAEIHWYQASSVGKVDIKFKRYYESKNNS